MNRMVPNSAANSSGPSVGASSLVTDANSALSGGPQLQRSASINTESYTRLPASPMSFSSNNISGSSPMDGSSIVQQSSHQEPMQKQGASSVTSQSTVQDHLGNLLHAQKKPRVDMRQEDVHQHAIQQFLHRQDSMQLQGHPNPQLQAMIQQQQQQQQQQRFAQRQQQQQQMLQSLPQMQRAQFHQHQQQMRNNFQQQAFLEKQPIESGICARRLMQYIYHQRHRTQEDSILYWRKFVVQYFAPRARKRWCLAMYDNVGNQAALGAFPRSSTEAWQCGICGSKSGKGFEATFEVLPRLNQIKFDRGVIDELLFVDLPNEYRLPSGVMVLEYAKAVQETVYDQLRVVREGQLRIIFSQELKILLWEFCARRHEEFFPRRLVAPQVNQLLQVAQKVQNTVTESGSSGVSAQEMQANCSMFVNAGRQLAKSLELQSLNDLGFSKRYVRCLQIAEVVSSMKDLIEFSQEHKTGPIESLKNYAQQAAAKLQSQKMQEMEQLVNAQCLPGDQSTLNKILGNHPALTGHLSNSHTGNRVLNNNAQTAAALNNYQMLRNSIGPGPNQNAIQSDASCSLGGPNQAQQVQLPGSITSILSNSSVNGLSGSHQQQQPSLSVLPQQNNMQPSQANQMQQHAIQQMLNDMMVNNRGMPQQSLSAPNVGGNVAADVIGAGGSLTPRMNTGPVRSGPMLGNSATGMPSHALGPAPSRSNSFKSATNTGGNSFNSRQDLPQNLHLPELDHDIVQEFAENGIFNGEPTGMGYDWKM